MAWAQATATDWIDMLRLLKSFATGGINAHTAGGAWIDGTSGVVPSGDVWSALSLGAGMTALPGSGSATDGEFYLQGQGSDPADQIIIGFQTYRNAGNGVFGVRMRGYTAYNSLLTFSNMPGVSPQGQAAFANSSFNCFFWVTSRRIMAVARIGTTDILIHSGFPQIFGTRSQYPYPLFIAGSVLDETFNTAQNNFGQSCLPDPAGTTAYLRWVDGTWQNVAHYTGAGATRAQQRVGTTYSIWPQRDVAVTDGSDNSLVDNEDTLFEAFASTARQVSSSEISAYPLLPCILHTNGQVIGQLEGLYMVPGLGLNSGDTISDGTDTYDVFKNTWRSETVDFFCIRRT